MAKLYEYAVIYTPPKQKDEPQGRAVLVVDVKRVLAETDAEVSILAARAIPDEYTDKLDNVQIAIRPF